MPQVKLHLFLFIFLLIASFSKSNYAQNPCAGTSTVNYLGKTYNTVQIGNQCWLKENLDVGNLIQNNQNAIDNGIIEKYCYNNDINNCNTYGALYQWAEAVQYKNGASNNTLTNPSFTGSVQGICPNGWHIPTTEEFQTLVSTVNNDGNSLKAIGQGTGDGAGTNTSGFTALLAGYKRGGFFGLGVVGYFWSTTEQGADYAVLRTLSNTHSIIYGLFTNKVDGNSVRCIKDINTSVLQDPNQNETLSQYFLSQNYPNPFNPSTTISYTVPEQSNVKIKIYDMLGIEIATIVNDNKPAGSYTVEFDASNLVSGIYFYKIQAGDYTQTKKMIMLK